MKFKMKVTLCARCGVQHDDIVFSPLSNPINTPSGVLNYWAVCPVYKQPILLAVNGA